MSKVYVITGSTSGIGKALVEYFIKQGNCVFAGYRNSEKIKDLPEGAIPFYINSNDEEAIVKAAEFIKSKTDKIDTLINVSGCVVAGAVEYISTDEIRRQFDVNVLSHLLFTQNLLQLLDGGKIINISSMASFGFFPFVAPYCASKRTLDILFQALALETKRNIKVVSIKPGVIATPLWEKSISENQQTLEACKNYDKEIIYLVDNAKNNGVKGLSVDKVVKTVVKADSSKRPKSSYVVGIDAIFSQMISHLPQDILNKFVKLKLSMISK